MRRASAMLLHLSFWTVVAAIVTTLAALESPTDDWRASALAWTGTGVLASTLAIPLLRKARGGVLVLVVALVASVGWLLLLALVGLALPSPESSAREVVTVFLFMLLVMGAWSGGGASVLHLGRVRSAADAERRALAAAREAKLATLRAQLGPHFLCNALNTVASTIDEDPARAQALLVSLADLLREGYATDESETCTLGDELERARAYLAIEEARFEDALNVEIDIEPTALSWSVPTLLLQPLLENAVRHGMRTAGPPLRVSMMARVRAGAFELSIDNDGSIEPDPTGTGIGLTNTRARLEGIYGARHTLTLTERGHRVRLRLRVDPPS